jgi:hypothetical protein
MPGRCAARANPGRASLSPAKQPPQSLGRSLLCATPLTNQPAGDFFREPGWRTPAATTVRAAHRPSRLRRLEVPVPEPTMAEQGTTSPETAPPSPVRTAVVVFVAVVACMACAALLGHQFSSSRTESSPSGDWERLACMTRAYLRGVAQEYL